MGRRLTTQANRKATVVKRTGSHRGLPYAVGEYHYCNWPILFNKDGNYKIFLEDKYEHLYEQTWMSLAMNLIREGRLNPGSLLATAINHERAFHYDGATRRENEHYDNYIKKFNEKLNKNKINTIYIVETFPEEFKFLNFKDLLKKRCFKKREYNEILYSIKIKNCIQK